MNDGQTKLVQRLVDDRAHFAAEAYELEAEVARLQAEVARLAHALTFYASSLRYVERFDAYGRWTSDIQEDAGVHAREALRTLNGGQP